MIGRDAEHQFRIELDGQAGRKVASDDDDVLSQAGNVGRVREIQKLLENLQFQL